MLPLKCEREVCAIRNRSERGFSLIEALIAAAVASVVIIGALALMGASTRRAAEYAETAEMDDRRAAFSDLIQRDLDRAGHNLLALPLAPAGPVAGQFLPNNEYSSTPGVLTKIGPTGWSSAATLNSQIVSGEGYLQFTPESSGDDSGPECLVDFTSAADGSFRLIYISGSSVTIFENDMSLPIAVTPHQVGDAYKIAIEPDEATGRVINYYRRRSGAEVLLHKSAAPMLYYPISASAKLYYSGERVINVELFASVISEDSPAIANFPPLPIDKALERRLDGAVSLSAQTPTGLVNAAVVLSGDEDIDPVYLKEEFLGTDTRVRVGAPRRGYFSPGDYVLLLDRRTGNLHSALYQVVLVLPLPEGLMLELGRTSVSQAAWQRLYSPGGDYVHTFAGGSALVRLAPLVTYALADDKRVVRYQGYRQVSAGGVASEGEVPATVLFGASDFSVIDASTATERAYMASMVIFTEGQETEFAEQQAFTYKSTPRALNAVADYTKILPQN